MSQPCVLHKQTGTACGECGSYDPVCERVLIVKLGAIGDVLRTTGLLAPLRARYPQSHVTWVTRAPAAPLLERNPLVDRVLTVESNYLEFLLSEHFDLALVPDAEPLSAAIAALARSEQTNGFVADGRGGVRPTNAAARDWWRLGLDDALKRANRRTYSDWLSRICDLRMPAAPPMLVITDDEKHDAIRRLRQLAPRAERWIGFNTGGSSRWREKRWNRSYYAQLARLAAAEDPDAAIVLAGGAAEHVLNRELQHDYPFVDGGTANSIAQFGALISVCDWVLTGDTLGYHVACAVGTPACCLVGPTSPWELDDYGRNVILHASLDCIGCYHAKCPLSTTCMDVLPPEAVWSRLAQWRSAAIGRGATGGAHIAIPVACS